MYQAFCAALHIVMSPYSRTPFLPLGSRLFRCSEAAVVVVVSLRSLTNALNRLVQTRTLFLPLLPSLSCSKLSSFFTSFLSSCWWLLSIALSRRPGQAFVTTVAMPKIQSSVSSSIVAMTSEYFCSSRADVVGFPCSC